MFFSPRLSLSPLVRGKTRHLSSRLAVEKSPLPQPLNTLPYVPRGKLKESSASELTEARGCAPLGRERVLFRLFSPQIQEITEKSGKTI